MSMRRPNHERSSRIGCHRLAALGTVSLLTAVALAGPTFEETPDAGSTPGTSQPVSGPGGGAGRITGTLTGTADNPDFEDMFLICITDPLSFAAVVDPLGTTFDTQLWLFDFQGFGLLANDNDPQSFPTIFSRVDPPATDGTNQVVPGPGLYFLAVTSKHNNPFSNAGPIFNDASANGTEISGPDGPGANLPLAGWSQGPGTTGGSYAINLTGVKFLELPCEINCPSFATIDADAATCGGGADPNGGCSEPGNPLQDLGPISPASYRVACGTTGTFPPASRDSDWYRFHLDQPAFVRATLIHQLPGGGAATNMALSILEGDACGSQTTAFAGVSGNCPFDSGEVPLPAGDHVVVVTVDAVAPAGPACPTEYLLWLTARGPSFATCAAPFSEPCGAPHPTPGCNDLGCCEAVCGVDPICCEAAWDEPCVKLAAELCLGFAYECDPDPAAPPNDCAIMAMDLAIGSSVTAETLAASTDGPANDAGPCTPVKDVWYLIQSPGVGKLRLETCGSDFDTSIAAYELGLSPAVDPLDVFDGTHLVGCADEGCGQPGGASRLEVNVPTLGMWYLVRVGGSLSGGATSGLLTTTATFVHLVFTTGPTHPLLFDPDASGSFTPTNVSLPSGKLSLAQPQRWSAQAFTVPGGPSGGGYELAEIHGYGTTPPDVLNQTLNYIIWGRNGGFAPVDGDQVVTGSVPFPIPTDLPAGAPFNEDHRIDLPAGTVLAPGDYWLTLYAGNGGPPNLAASFNWYLGADDGINVLDLTGEPFTWRSNMFPIPGFVPFVFPPLALKQLPGKDPADLYNTGFTLCGFPAATSCDEDLDGDRVVGPSDLAILLGAWGGRGAADLDGDGVVGPADLALLLGAWGPC